MTNSPDRVDVATAARMLGITTDGVRRRIARGRLQGVRVDGRWQVVLSGTESVLRETEQDTTPIDIRSVKPDAVRDNQDSQPDRPEQPDATRSGQDTTVTGIAQDLIDTLKRENERLWTELEARTEALRQEQETRAREVSELHRLLQEAHTLALPAAQHRGQDMTNTTPVESQPRPQPIEEQETMVQQDSKRPWWKLWVR
jgi:hypothetical protein